MSSKNIATYNKSTIIIYHKNCSDGFGSAYAAWKVLGDTADYHAAMYNPAPHEIPDVTNKTVYLCDFSYTYPVICEMIKKAKSLLILDHHKTSFEALTLLPDKYKIIDQTHSGAWLTWRHFHPDKEVPRLINYIQDRDLWQFKLPNSEHFFARFKAVPFEFKEYDLYMDDKKFDSLMAEGRIIYEYEQHTIRASLKHAALQLARLPDNKYYIIAYLNSSTLKSELGNELCKRYKMADFAVVYSYDDISNKTFCSLRSTDEQKDVEIVAKMFNGGGHRNASGVTMDGIHTVLSNTNTVHYTDVNIMPIIDTLTHDIEHINDAKYAMATTIYMLNYNVAAYITQRYPKTQMILFKNTYNELESKIFYNRQLLNGHQIDAINSYYGGILSNDGLLSVFKN
ncbi:MAG: DHH family phosphohydrolase [Faunusvirus sp.]|jgi:oligoribonuclease NrnB/cAMP/cGMP phosphodiesterase (DHH superfamily)|uniref:DHH family phosphohydrolase n=1 Tax=Faunusvirus sp. TaxID=2487766 RepID=A0A3G4ZXQ4_9VIRU|nr:MAG: DHH family phosphohydrolase [Faunusvirus sp.]